MMTRRNAVFGVVSILALAGCSVPNGEVNYLPADRTDAETLLVYVGDGDYREVLSYAVDNLLPEGTKVQIEDAPDDAYERIASGVADLGFFQEAYSFDAHKSEYGELSVASAVNVVPYALYSSKWDDVEETESWVNTGIVEDEVNGASLPHGSRVVLPFATEEFARGLYLLQSAGLVQLDRDFGGTTEVDLTVTEANVVDSLRHLSLLGLVTYERLPEVYVDFDAIVLPPEQARSLGLDPAVDALAVEPGPDNPYAHVLVAPARLAGDQRLLELTHALESPELAQFLAATYGGANIPASSNAPSLG